MNKKLVCLALALLLTLGTTSLAFATVPSKTTSDLVKPVGVVSATGEPLPVAVSVPPPEAAQAATETLASIAAFVQQGGSLVKFFDQTVQDAITSLLPVGINAESLTMNEFLPIKIADYDAAYGDITVSFEFATEYVDGQPIVAMVGIKEGETVTWYAQKAEVVEGVVRIYFTQDVLEKMQTGDVMLAILSGEAPAN